MQQTSIFWAFSTAAVALSASSLKRPFEGVSTSAAVSSDTPSTSTATATAPAASTTSSKKNAKKARKEEKVKVSKAVPPPDESKVIRELVDLTPCDNQKRGEDGTYVDRREGFRTSYGACPRFTVIKGHIYPKLDATTLPPPGKRVNGKLYPSPHPARFGKWNSGGKGKLQLSCPWCPYLTKEGKSNQAHFSHDEGEGGGISICQQCRGVADMPKALQNACDKCGKKEASYPDTLGGKGANLCSGCAKENGSHEPLQHKRCEEHGIIFDMCRICCPSEKLNCRLCIVCYGHKVNPELYKSGERMCAGCRADAGGGCEDANKGKKGKKVEEERVEELLVECGFKKDAGGAILPRDGYFKREHQINFRCDDESDESNSGKKSCRIDFIVNVSGVFFFLEVDEHQHKYGYGNKDMACDMKRMADVQAMVIQAEGGSLADQMGAPYWVRYNPHSFQNGDEIVDVPREVKERELMQRLDGSVGRSDEVRIEYFNYNVDAKGELEVLKHPEYHPHFRERAFSHI